MKHNTNFRKVAVCCLLFLARQCLVAQSPANDQSWNTTTYKYQNEFDPPGQNDLNNNWKIYSPASWQDTTWDFCFLPSNVAFNNSILPGNTVLELTSQQCPTCSQYGQNIVASSGAVSTNAYYQYGYYEASCNMASFGGSYMPAFWLQSSSPTYYHEMDMEIQTKNSGIFDLTTTLWNSYTSSGAVAFNEKNYYPVTPLANGFHKYGIEWTPNHLVLYYDDVPFRSIWHDIPNHGMEIKLSLGFYLTLGAPGPQGAHDNTNVYPGKQYIDYVRAYDLNMGDCAKEYVVSLASPFKLETYTRTVKKAIIFQQGHQTVLSNQTIPAGTSLIMRADEITIYGDFTAQETDLTLLPTSCY